MSANRENTDVKDREKDKGITNKDKDSARTGNAGGSTGKSDLGPEPDNTDAQRGGEVY